MAFSAEQWNRAKFLFELGYSLRDIENDCGISHVQISRKSKKELWEKVTAKQSIKSDVIEVEKKNVTLEAQKVTVAQRVSTLSDFEITILHEKIIEETGIKSLITNTQSLAIIRANESLTRGTKTTLMKVRQYDSKGNATSETYEPFETELEPSDIKAHIDSIDKASLTLGVNQRHAKSGDVNVNTQTNVGIQTITRKIVD